MFLNKVKITIGALLLSLGTAVQAQNFKVVLDAGHGGRDFGAVQNNFTEKKIVLDITLKVGKLLENAKNIDVVYTRKTDEFIELKERSNIANKANGDIFVSIHANSVKNAPDAYGTETFLMGISKNKSNLEVAKQENNAIVLENDYKTTYAGYDPSNPESIIGLTLIQEQYVLQSADLANKIQTKFDVDAKRKNRGVKQGPFWVLHGAFMPSVLVEVGFISNLEEGEYLNSEAGKNEIARSIANAIIDYKNIYHTSSKTSQVVKSNDEAKTISQLPDEERKEAIKRDIQKRENERLEALRVEAEKAKQLEKEKVESKTSNPTEVNNSKGILFMVQIAASSKDLNPTPANFNGLEGVTVNKEDKLFKYYYGSTSDYETAKKSLAFAKTKYSSAYLVAFKDGNKISIQEALR